MAYKIIFSVGALGAVAAFIDVRMGLLGYEVIQINKDDEYETISRGLFYDTAYWNPGDVTARVYHCSVKPIRFEFTNDYSGYRPPIDPVGNKT